jgi:hypothetical protein
VGEGDLNVVQGERNGIGGLAAAVDDDGNSTLVPKPPGGGGARDLPGLTD